MKVYLANALFCEADRLYNDHLAHKIRQHLKDIDLYVPQENAEINDKSQYADSLMIEEADSEKLLEADILVAVLDGEVIDSGVSTEVGLFSSTGKPIIGLWTDIRQYGRDNQKKIDALIEDGIENQFMYRNIYTVGRIKRFGIIERNSDNLILTLEEFAKLIN